MRFLKQLNEGLEKTHKNMKTSDSTLNEALPKDLMQKIARTRAYKGYGGRNGDQQRHISNTYDYDTKSIKDVTGVKDYQNATAQELNAADVLAMKKAGEDLSNIYVIDDAGYMINLDKNGHPTQTGSTYSPRANQSLKKTLDNAVKIYRADIKDLIDSDPEKARARFANPDVRGANMQLGHNRPRAYERGRRDSHYADEKRSLSKLKPQIDAIKAEYEEGDISRKEMERRIDNLKRSVGSYSWTADEYQRVRNRNAENRYKASELALQEPFDKLQDARQRLKSSKYRLADAQQELNKVQSGDTSGYLNDWSDKYLNAKKQVADITQKIADLQKQLAKYQSELDNGAYDADVEKYEYEINQSQAEIDAAQADIDRLLRRTESFIRISKKRLNESLKKNRTKSSIRRK